MVGRHSASTWRASDASSRGEGLSWRSRRVWVPVLVVLVGLLAAVGMAVARTPKQQCARETLQILAAPDIAGPLKAASAKTPGPDGVCLDLRVTARSSAEVLAELKRRRADPPDVWIPDSSEWVQQLRRATSGVVTPVQSLWVWPSIASSPLVLATSPKGARSLTSTAAGGWSQVLSGRTPLAVGDPSTSTEGLLAVAAAQNAFGPTSGAPTRRLVSSFVNLSPRVVDGATSALGNAATQPVVVSEQAVIRANAGPGASDLQAVYPRDGGRSLDFPVVEFAPPEREPRHGDAVGVFVRSLYETAAQTALREAGLRDAAGDSFPSTVNFEGVAATAVIRPSPPLSDRQMTNALRVWYAAQRRNRTLVVVDVSGSMAGTKIELAAAAVRNAVSYLPDDAALGLWAFSTNLDGSSPWRRLVSLGTLGAPSVPDGRRQTLRVQTRNLPRLAARRGDTGLYRTTWAAFRAVRAGYDPGRYNSVVLLTDGANTTPGLSRAGLLSKLRSARSASRSIPVFTVAIGPDADRRTLHRIAAATGGAQFQVDSIGDIRDVFVEAVIREGS